MDQFSAGSSLHFAWETFKKRPWFLIGVSIVVLALFLLFKPGKFNAPAGEVLLIDLVCIAVTIFVDMGFTAFLLKIEEDAHAAKFSDLWHPYPFWNYLGVNALVGILVLIGLLLLVVPGIILILMWMFVKYLVIARNLGPIEAMKESMRITRGHRWELLALLFLVVALNILGAVCFLVGLFVTVPITALSLVHAYRVLERQADAATA